MAAEALICCLSPPLPTSASTIKYPPPFYPPQCRIRRLPAQYLFGRQVAEETLPGSLGVKQVSVEYLRRVCIITTLLDGAIVGIRQVSGGAVETHGRVSLLFIQHPIAKKALRIGHIVALTNGETVSFGHRPRIGRKSVNLVGAFTND